MTNLQLLEAIGMIDEETVLDAEQPVAKVLPAPRRRLVRQITAVAACVCLLFGGALAVQMGGWNAKSGSAENNAYSDGTPTWAGQPGGTTVVPAEGMEDDGVAEAEPTVAATTAPKGEEYTSAAGAATSAGAYTTTTMGITQAVTTTAASYEATETTENAATPEVSSPADGLIVYREDFNGSADTENSEAALVAAGMKRLTVAEDGVYRETNAAFAMRGGRLYFDNITPAGSGDDGYYAITQLDDSYMRPIVSGKYTLQYDLEYTDAVNTERYAAIITELSEDGKHYNSFHLRIGGKANHQSHYYGLWKTYSAYDPATDLNPSAADPTGAEGTPLVKKLLGLDIAQVSEKMNFQNVKVTIRLCWDPEMGHHVYMKTDAMPEFVKVSEPSIMADGPMYLGWDGCSVALKLGAGVAGYIDNIHIWVGWGEEPTADARWYQPRK